MENEIKYKQVINNTNKKINRITFGEKNFRRHQYSKNLQQKYIAKNKEIKQYEKLIIENIKYIQIWWKTIFQIIKIQKNIRGFLFRSKLLENLDNKEIYADNLIRLMKAVKKILFGKFIFMSYCKNIKYFFSKWYEIIIKRKIIKNIILKFSSNNSQMYNSNNLYSLINLNNKSNKSRLNIKEFKNSSIKPIKYKKIDKNSSKKINLNNSTSTKNILLNKVKNDSMKSINLLNKQNNQSNGKLKINKIQNNKVRNTTEKQIDIYSKFNNTTNNFKINKSYVNNKNKKNRQNKKNKNLLFNDQYNKNENICNNIIMNNVNKSFKSTKTNTNTNVDDNYYENEKYIYDNYIPVCALKNIVLSNSKIYENQLNQKNSKRKKKIKKPIRNNSALNAKKLNITLKLKKYFHLWVKRTIIHLFLDMLHIINNIFKFNKKLWLFYLKKYFYLFKNKLKERNKLILSKYFNKYKNIIFKADIIKNIIKIHQNNEFGKRSNIKNIQYRNNDILNNNELYLNYYTDSTIKIPFNYHNIKKSSSEKILEKLNNSINNNINKNILIANSRGAIISKIIELPIKKIKSKNDLQKVMSHNNSMIEMEYDNFLKYQDNNSKIISKRINRSVIMERTKSNKKPKNKKTRYIFINNLTTQRNKLIMALNIIEQKRILQANKTISKFLNLWKNLSQNCKNSEIKENYKFLNIAAKNNENDAIIQYTLSNDVYQPESELGGTENVKKINLLKNNIYVKKTIANKNNSVMSKSDAKEYSIKNSNSMSKYIKEIYLKSNCKIEEKEIRFIPLIKTKRKLFIEEKDNFDKIINEVKNVKKYDNELIQKSKIEMIKYGFQNIKKSLRMIIRNNSADIINTNKISSESCYLTI